MSLSTSFITLSLRFKVSIFSTLLALSSFTSSAQARPWVMGSHCGLTDEFGADAWQEVGRKYDLTRMPNERVLALPALVKSQLIATARLQLSMVIADGKVNADTVLGAVRGLREFSDANSLYVSSFEVNGRLFTQVLFYPGDNPGGVIFAAGTDRAVAEIADSNVACY